MTDIKKDLEELHYLNEIETFESKKRPKKILIVIIALFMVFLMVSFIFVNYPIIGILFGQIQSAKINGNAITTKSLQIIFTENTLTLIENVWNENKSVEKAVCFRGYRIDDTIVIDSGYVPTMYEQTYDHVSFKACDSETIMMFHTHPWKRCTASNVDMYSLRQRNAQNPDSIMVIMCEKNRFSVYD